VSEGPEIPVNLQFITGDVKLNQSRNGRNRIKLSDINTRIKAIREIIQQNILDERTTLIRSFLGFKLGTNDKFTNLWPELTFLRSNNEELSEFLNALPLQVRRLVVMREEICGFSKNTLYKKFAISNDLMTAFTNVKSILNEKTNNLEVNNDPTHLFEKILPVTSYPIEFIAFISLLSRIPLHWLMIERPEKVWSVENFRNVKSMVLEKNQFLLFLIAVSVDQYNVRAVIIENPLL
jgi:hypothetical protein